MTKQQKRKTPKKPKTQNRRKTVSRTQKPSARSTRSFLGIKDTPEKSEKRTRILYNAVVGLLYNELPDKHKEILHEEVSRQKK